MAADSVEEPHQYSTWRQRNILPRGCRREGTELFSLIAPGAKPIAETVRLWGRGHIEKFAD
jgi:hypothetical protein